VPGAEHALAEAARRSRRRPGVGAAVAAQLPGDEPQQVGGGPAPLPSGGRAPRGVSAEQRLEAGGHRRRWWRRRRASGSAGSARPWHQGGPTAGSATRTPTSRHHGAGRDARSNGAPSRRITEPAGGGQGEQFRRCPSRGRQVAAPQCRQQGAAAEYVKGGEGVLGAEWMVPGGWKAPTSSMIRSKGRGRGRCRRTVGSAGVAEKNTCGA
jgi:hypothetical protein